MHYALQITQAEGAFLVGVFLDETIYRTYSVYDVMTNTIDYQKKIDALDARDQMKRDDAVRKFQQACEGAKIKYSIHRDSDIALQDLKRESIFADLIIINEYETFSRIKQQAPTQFIKDLLSDVPCPVLITPAAYKKIDRIVLLYDGRPNSLYVIKMFTYLFDTMTQLPAEVLMVKEKKVPGTHLPDNKLMKEFIKRHFPKADYTMLKGDAELEITKHLRSYSSDVLVVLGAYRRSDLSRWFKTSMADVLMQSLDTPLFIAHNK